MRKYSADLVIGFYVEAENEEEAIKKIREEYKRDPLFYLDEAFYNDLFYLDEIPSADYTPTSLIGSAIDMKKVFEKLSKHYKWKEEVNKNDK
jgi:hypothetical protein